MSKVHIGIFGRRNQGKSMLINALAGQDIAIVSDVAGTTTDPVKKSMEIFGIGPCVLVDTAGLDDSGEVGEKRVAKSLESLKIIDIALLLISNNQIGKEEKELIEQFKKYELPYIIVHNKADLQSLTASCRQQLESFGAPVIDCSAATKQGLEELVQAIVKTTPASAYRQENLLDEIKRRGNPVFKYGIILSCLDFTLAMMQREGAEIIGLLPISLQTYPCWHFIMNDAIEIMEKCFGRKVLWVIECLVSQFNLLNPVKPEPANDIH